MTALHPQTLADLRSQLSALYREHEELSADEGAWTISLESETDLHAVCALLVDKMREAESMAGAVESRIAELKNRSDRYVERQKGIRKALYHLMVEAKTPKVETPEATLSIRKGTTRVEVPDPEAVPDDFCRFKREPDKASIKQAIDDGVLLNFATLVQGEPTLSVRTR